MDSPKNEHVLVSVERSMKKKAFCLLAINVLSTLSLLLLFKVFLIHPQAEHLRINAEYEQYVRGSVNRSLQVNAFASVDDGVEDNSEESANAIATVGLPGTENATSGCFLTNETTPHICGNENFDGLNYSTEWYAKNKSAYCPSTFSNASKVLHHCKPMYACPSSTCI